MKQIVVISGKGGTGKTILTGAFAAIAENKVMADCDVDAADLHLLLNPEIKEKHQFKSGVVASINPKKCIQCLKCLNKCRFDAIDNHLKVNSIACEGCGFCYHLCPVGAIELKENLSGEWYISETQYGSFVHAKLGIAEENSGKLVSLVRKQAQVLAAKQNKEFIIIDGSPGIGCPVIACVTGVDCAVIVTEPTLSGLHDAKRVIKVAEHFNVAIKLVINKYNLNEELTAKIEHYCDDNKIPVIGKIAFDEDIVYSVVNRKTLMEIDNNKLKNNVQNIWEKIIE